MANYTLTEAIPQFIKLLEEAGVREVSLLNDREVASKACNRILIGKYLDRDIAVICFPIVLRNADVKNKIPKQRYIDINSSAWNDIIKYWKKACLNNVSCFLLGIRHNDTEIGDYIFSVEGDLGLFSGKSVYIREEHLTDIRNNLEINVYDIPERSGKLAMFKREKLTEYMSSYENHLSSQTVISVIRDYVINSEEDNVSIVETNTATEGKRLFYYTSKYERKPSNRKAAIEAHGTTCFGCGFNFEEHYGERGAGYIEIHHINPLYSLDGEVEVDVEKDLIPLCSNCHRMVHRSKSNVLTLEDLKRILSENRKKTN